MRNHLLASIAILLSLAVMVLAADPVPLTTAEGKLLKADKEMLSFQPRDSSGKFGKAVTLKITGTSKITTLSARTMDKKLVMVQKDTDAKDLTAGQHIAVIYAEPTGQEPVLLSAIVQPAGDKK
jgi:hypothetical protein